MRSPSGLLAVLAVLAADLAGDAQAVIDCSRARSNAEKLICSSSRLGAADEMMARAFRDAIRRGRDAHAMMDSQRKWVEEVRDVCNDVDCMLKAYEERTLDLDNF
jgi:uncharacterized protein